MSIEWTAQNMLMSRLVNNQIDFLVYNRMRKEPDKLYLNNWESDELDTVFEAARATSLEEEGTFSLIGMFFQVEAYQQFLVELFTADVCIRHPVISLEYQILKSFKKES